MQQPGTDAERDEVARFERIAAAAEARARDRAARAASAAVETSTGVIRADGGDATGQASIQFRSRAERQRDERERSEQRLPAPVQQRSALSSRYQAIRNSSGDRSKPQLSEYRRGGPRDEDRSGPRIAGRPAGTAQYLDDLDDSARQSMLKGIRAEYLGEKKKRPTPAVAKKKNPRDFNADWDPTDDTSQDVNPLYQSRFERGLPSTAAASSSTSYRPGSLAAESAAAKARASARNRARSGLPPWMQAALPAVPSSTGNSSSLGTVERPAATYASHPAPSALSAASVAVGQDPSSVAVAAVGVGARVGRVRGSRSRRLAVLAAGEDIHWSDKRLTDMTDRDWRILREDFDIHFKGKKPPRPLRSWNEAGLHGSLMRAIDEMGYKEPSPIQRATVAAGMGHRDLMGIAETGSGKTAAFLLPMLHIILSGDPARRAACKTHGPLALILAPTRELAQQIEAETAKLCKFARVTSTCIVGGENIDEQAQTLRNGVEVLVATPGRLVECLDASLLVFNQCNYVVLDEADTMIDFGFEPQVTQILEVMASHRGSTTVPAASASSSSSSSAVVSSSAAESERTTIMFSATMAPAVERIALRFMSNTLKVRIGDDDSVKNRRISQEVIYTAENGKRKLLAAALRRGLRPAIVFVNTKKNCDTVARNVTDLGSSCIVLHGDKEQADRAAAIADFKAGRIEVLVATDVAGRGLDIPDVAQVINYDLPSDIQRYTHRIGRTGRAGKEGASVSFFTDDDEKILPSLRGYLLATGQSVPMQLERHSAVTASALG